MRGRLHLLVCLSVFLCTLAILTIQARAQGPIPVPIPIPSGMQQMGPPQAAPEFPPIAQVTQGFEARRGFLTLYVDMRKHRLLGEIPGQLLMRPFLAAVSIAGGQYTGWQWNDSMVYLERLDRKLILVEPEIRFKAQGSTFAEVVKRTYRNRVITAMPILAEGPGGSCLIDFTDLFATRSGIFLGSLGRGIDPSLTKIVKAKAFPGNVEIEFDLAGPGAPGGASSSSLAGGGIAVHYSIRELPNTGYVPRVADDRIGYFLTAFKDFSKDPREETRFVRFINRWNLQKMDPSLEVSPPREPIVFYVEKTVPVRYRRYVHEGILEWNRAFERVGISPAIVVYQQTDSNDFKDYDPEDTRFNFFSWITSERSFAMGPSRVHPETGQILDADIIFDDSMIRDWLADYSLLVEKGPVRDFHPALRQYLEDNPDRHPMKRWRKGNRRLGLNGTQGENPLFPTPIRPPDDWGLVGLGAPDSAPFLKAGYCDFGDGIRHQVNFGLVALSVLADQVQQAAPPTPPAPDVKKDSWPEDFIAQVVKEVVTHEVGHTLGLRHNFKGSAWLSMDEINAPQNPPEATSGSIMDYNPANISPAGKPQGYWNTRTLGPYDYWAIEYGYTLKGDPNELARIASRVAEKGLAYGTDEDTSSSDPLINRFDMGSDPLVYARLRMELAQQVWRDLVAKIVKQGQSYQRARQAFDMVLYEFARATAMATRFVGGHYIHRDHKGDPNERRPIEPVPVEKQREALNLVCEQLFSPTSLVFPPELINYLAVGRWYHWGSEDTSNDPEYPIQDRILQTQLWALFDFLNPRTLTLVSDAEARVAAAADAMTIPELFTKLTDSIWAEVKEAPKGTFTNRKPLISTLRRNLQQEFVGQMIDLILEGDGGASPHSAKTQARYQLSRLRSSIAPALAASKGQDLVLDDYSRAHLEEMGERIEKALQASYSRNAASSGGGATIIQIGQPAEGGGR